MNVATQLDQTTVQAVMPKLQLTRRDMQPISGVFSGVNFPLFSPILSITPQNPLTAQINEVLQATRDLIVYSIALDHIDIDGEILPFVIPIIAHVSFNENVYSCQNEELGIITMSPTMEECIKDFKDEISFVWNEYGREDENRLTDDAKELKRRISSHIKQLSALCQ